jgi:putative membrane protein
VLLILAGISFAGLNASSVQINIYFTILSMPVSVLIIIIFGMGLVFGFLVSLRSYLRLKVKHRKLKNQFKLIQD